MARVTRRRVAASLLFASALVGCILAWTLRERPLYRVAILPSLGGPCAEGCSLNDIGQVVGVEDAGDDAGRLFLWDRRGGVRDLGLVTSDPIVIDNSGRICGTMPDANGPRAFIWRPGSGRVVLDTRGGRHSVALAMNNRGQVVGLSYFADGLPLAFVWDEEGKVIRELRVPDGGRCWPQSINDAGNVLAMSIRVPADDWRWYIIEPNGATPLDGIPPSLKFQSMNNGFRVAGVDEPWGATPRLVLWQRQSPLRFAASLGEGSAVTRLNDKGQIAYTNFSVSIEGRQSPDRNEPNGVKEKTISYLLDPVRGRMSIDAYLRDMKHFVVEDLNGKGAILGTAEMKDGTTRPVLLEPTPGRWGK
jgi:hypothetical protein